MIPGRCKVTVAPLICSAPMSGSMVSMKPAAPIACAVAATLEMVAASESKSNVYVQMISLPRTKDRMNASALWQLSTSPAVMFLRQTSAAAASGKCTPPIVGAATTTNNPNDTQLNY